VKVGVYALLMSSVGLVAAHLSHAQSLDFSPWALHTSAPDGNSVCYAASQLVNSTRGIEVRVASTNDGNVGMILRESEWDTQPDEVSTIVKVTFYTDKLEQYSQRFRASKKGQSIVFGFGPTESGYVSDWLRVSTTMTIDLVRTKDATSTASSEPMLSEIKLPWIVKMSGAPEALAQLMKCNADNASRARPSASLPPMKEEDKRSRLSVMYVTYSIAERCADANTSFNKQQVNAMQSFVKFRVSEMNNSRDDNDKTWNIVQSQVAGMNLTMKDCTDTRQQSAYIFPPEIFISGGKRNPF